MPRDHKKVTPALNIDRSAEAAAEELLSDGLMTIREAAVFLGLSRSKLYELMDQGALAHVKIDGSRRIPRKGAVRFAASKLVLPEPPR